MTGSRYRATVAISVVLVALLATVAVGGVSAQSGGNMSESTSTPTASTGERIDNSTVLVDSSYDNETGMVSVTLKSETIQEVTLSDAGAFVDGGVVNQRTVTLGPGETATVSLDATRTDSGFVGVSIATDDTLYAVPVESPSTGGGGGSPIPKRDDALALLAGISTVTLGTLGLNRRRRRKTSDSVRRVDGP